jgi:hypothetical protein
MTTPLASPAPANNAATLGYRHLRTAAGLVGMALAVGSAIAIQVARAARDAALLARGCPASAVPLPSTWLQFVYSLAIPVGLPLLLFLFSLMLFSPSVLGQMIVGIRSLLPWHKATGGP